MKVLGIDTSTAFAGVGLSVDGEISMSTWWSRHNHGREVMPAVMRLLEATGIRAQDLDAVAVALGPGGFSAVRVGIATGQGLVAATDAPLLGIPTHLIQAFPCRDEVSKGIVSLIPIGRKQVSYAVYGSPFSSFDDEIESGICEIPDVADRFGDEGTILCGEGTIDPDEVGTASRPARDPRDLLAIALARLERGHGLDAAIEPIYSRPPTISAPKRN